ncbi:hypothetical protein CDEST_01141 [Colletotrichum destructivum]|uniref:Secreted protein n=1 Tax=Colletotrichum destructivum TaxID=34406 RepID=A0AAX4HZ93_9PEZI|nr:hypothetical protein CDEST_01141 [Colletotrichum destructivum]
MADGDSGKSGTCCPIPLYRWRSHWSHRRKLRLVLFFFLFPFASTHELVCAKENRTKGIAPSFQRCQLHTQSVKTPSIANSIPHREFSTARLP